MKYDDLVNSILHEQHFGGSPFEQKTGVKKHITFEDAQEDAQDFISKQEAKDIQNALNKQIADRRGGKKKSALQMVDPEQLSEQGKQVIAQMHQAVKLYQQGSAIGGDPSLRSAGHDMENEVLLKAFGGVELDYVGWDKGSGLGTGAHLYRYPATGGGVVGVPHDKDGFRIEAHLEGDQDIDAPEVVDLYPVDRFDLINFFAKGSPHPFTEIVKGRGA